LTQFGNNLWKHIFSVKLIFTYVKLIHTFILDSFILEFMFSNYIIVMLFVQLLINYVIFTLKNVKYQFITKYSDNNHMLNTRIC